MNSLSFPHSLTSILGWRSTFLAFLFCGVLATSTFANAHEVVYVAAKDDRAILVYHFDAPNLILRQTLKLPAEPGALCISPDKSLLLIALRSSGELASCRIDANTGKLKLVNVVPAGADPAQISTDASGRYLLTAYYVAAKVSVHAIAPDGQLSPQPLQEIPTLEKAHAIMLDPSQHFVFVPHTGPNAIFQFRWEASTGRLKASQPDRLLTPQGSGPRHLAWHPKQPVALIDNEQGSSVTSYQLEPNTGQLKPLSTATTLPNDYLEPNSTAEIKVHPRGEWLYVSNRGHHSIARLAIEPSSMALRWIDTTPTEAVPRSFDLTEDGNYILVAGESSGGIQIYRVDHSSGALTPIRRYQISPGLWWITCLSLPD